MNNTSKKLGIKVQIRSERLPRKSEPEMAKETESSLIRIDEISIASN